MNNKSMTLIEMMVVLIIIGVLSTISITHYGAYRERAFDKEAQANLRLIGSAERIWRMESNNTQYLTCGDIVCINNNLRLSISAPPTGAWTYRVAAVGGTSFCALATRHGGDGRNWHLHGAPGTADTDPVAGPCD